MWKKIHRVLRSPVPFLFRRGVQFARKKWLPPKKIDLKRELVGPEPAGQPQAVLANFPAALFRSWMTGGRQTADQICETYGKSMDWQCTGCRDPKIPWNLSRFQFLPTLVKAYEVHHDERYSRAARDIIHDWILKNPFPSGVNWEIPMEAAIRACQFSIGWFYLRESEAWKNRQFVESLLSSLIRHGQFIFQNLEYGPGWNGNHLIADFAGLLLLGVLFPNFREASKWKAMALTGLEREMKNQVYEDGVHTEASIPYHGFATEIFGYTALICRENDLSLSQVFWNRLEKMFGFVWYYTKPNGWAPKIGDGDDGRFFLFEDFFAWEPRDQRHLLRLASLLFPENEKFTSHSIPKSSRAFHKGKIYILRKDDFACIVDCGENGQNGNGGHAHCDTLSFELTVNGEDFIIDPGTGSYTGDPVIRNKFRGTRMHNTVMVDRKEQSRFRRDTLFGLHNDASVFLWRWDSNEKQDCLDVQHSGYERLKFPVTHRRTFSFDKEKFSLSIVDSFCGRGAHSLEWNFHFANGVTLRPRREVGVASGASAGRQAQGDMFIAERNGKKIKISLPPEIAGNARIREDFVSPRYGVKEKAQVLTITIDSRLCGDDTYAPTFHFTILPA